MRHLSFLTTYPHVSTLACFPRKQPTFTWLSCRLLIPSLLSEVHIGLDSWLCLPYNTEHYIESDTNVNRLHFLYKLCHWINWHIVLVQVRYIGDFFVIGWPLVIWIMDIFEIQIVALQHADKLSTNSAWESAGIPDD